jgi:hypothetical protein
MFTLLGVSLYVQPSVRPGITALAAYLCTQEYSIPARERILAHVAHEGTLAGLVDRGWLEPADEVAAEQVYCEDMEPVPAVCHQWLDPGVYIDVESYEEALQRALADTDPELPRIGGR